MTDTRDKEVGNVKLQIWREGDREFKYVEVPGDTVMSLAAAFSMWLVRCEDIRQRQSSGRTPATHRKNAIDALSALTEILKEHGLDDLPDVLARLWAALTIVDEYKQRHPMFEPGGTALANAVFDNRMRVQIKALAAAQIQFLMEERNCSQRTAARRVAKALSTAGFNAPGEMKGGSEAKWDTVKRWHTEATSGKSDWAWLYNEKIAAYRRLKTRFPAETCLKMLPEIVREVRWADC